MGEQTMVGETKAAVGENRVVETMIALKERFATVTDDERPGYEGIMVTSESLIEVATALRDEFGFNYLSSVTGVDQLADNKMEVVYHLYQIEINGSNENMGGVLVMKVQTTDREDPVIPSLTPLWPGANFQEREIWDLYGIKFEGHPDLRRILMWEGFDGFPMRKDWREPFYEEETKPFGSRWPEGDVFRAEERNLYGKNVKYPEGWMPEHLEELDDLSDDEIYEKVKMGRDSTPGLKTDKVTVNIGPQHPSTHGVFRIVVTLDGETIVKLDPVMGYLHRNHEKIGERNTFIQNIPYTDRLDYLSSMSNNHGYVLTIEKLLGSKVPPRAEWLRILVVELTRIANHAWALGFFMNDLGALQTPMLYLYKERELILDFFEALAGSRMMCNYMRFGGVAYDLPPKVREQETLSFLNEMVHDRLPKALEEFDFFMTENEIVRARCIGVGHLSSEDAIAYSTAGPLLRASGVQYDVRRAEPYSYYDQLDFDIPVRYNGDLYDRYLIRLDEMWQSLRILRQVLVHLEGTIGESVFDGKPQYAIRAPKAGEAYGRVENPKGELGYYVTTKVKGTNPERYHIRAPSFINLTPFGLMSEGHKVADVVAILGSIDIVLGEVDR